MGHRTDGSSPTVTARSWTSRPERPYGYDNRRVLLQQRWLSASTTTTTDDEAIDGRPDSVTTGLPGDLYVEDKDDSNHDPDELNEPLKLYQENDDNPILDQAHDDSFASFDENQQDVAYNPLPDYLELNGLVDESLQDLQELLEQTQSVLRCPSTRDNTEAARELLDTWLKLHHEWYQLFASSFLFGGMDRQPPPASGQASATRLVHAMLQACRAIHDLVPFVEPRLAPYFQYFEHSMEQPEALLSSSSSLSSVASPLPPTALSSSSSSSSDANDENEQSMDTPKNQEVDPDVLYSLATSVMELSAKSLQACFSVAPLSSTRARRRGNRNDASANDDNDDDRTMTDLPSWTDIHRLLREIPQRTQSLFERLHSLLGSTITTNETTTTTSSSLTEDFASQRAMLKHKKILQPAMPHVLLTWAYSREHHRAARAQHFFETYQQWLEDPSTTNNNNPSAAEVLQKAQVYRILLRAWCFDDFDKQAAFNATGHLISLEKLLQNHGTGRMAQLDLSQDMSDNDSFQPFLSSSYVGPSMEEYHLAMQAWTRDESKYPHTRAFRVVQQLLRLRDRRPGQEDEEPVTASTTTTTNSMTPLRPDVKCFAYLFQTAASRPLMDPIDMSRFLKESWNIMVAKLGLWPNAVCFASAIRAWKFVALHPNLETQTQAMEVNVKTERDKAVRWVLDLFDTAKRAVKEQDHDESNDTGDRPHLSTAVYNDVLESISVWPVSMKRKTALAQEILEEMEKGNLHDMGGEVFRPPPPNARSYQLLVNIWKSALPTTTTTTAHELGGRGRGGTASPLNTMAKHQEALVNVKKLLWQMTDRLQQQQQQKTDEGQDDGPEELSSRQDQYLHKREGVRFRTNMRLRENELIQQSDHSGFPVEVLNAFVDLCAHCPVHLSQTIGTTPSSQQQQPQQLASLEDKDEASSDQGLLIFREALSAVESFRRREQVQPNWGTYAGLLYAADNLLSSSSAVQKHKIIDRVFKLACSDGMVEELVLQALMAVTTTGQYEELVLSQSISNRSGGPTVPEEWTRKVLGAGRTLSLDGRKVRPLSVSGKVTETRAMKEFRMRKLREKPGQKLLRGGRTLEEKTA